MNDGAFTRGSLTNAYYPAPVAMVRLPGAVKVSLRDNNGNPWATGIPQVWPIARPVTAPSADGAPFYISGDETYTIARGGSLRFTPPRPVKEMDPSDPNTWQREYRFT